MKASSPAPESGDGRRAALGAALIAVLLLVPVPAWAREWAAAFAGWLPWLLPASSSDSGGLDISHGIHLLLFALWTPSLTRAVTRSSRLTRSSGVLVVICSATLYGGVLEVLQSVSGYRSGSLLDLAANVAGTVLSLGWLQLAMRRRDGRQ